MLLRLRRKINSKIEVNMKNIFKILAKSLNEPDSFIEFLFWPIFISTVLFFILVFISNLKSF